MHLNRCLEEELQSARQGEQAAIRMMLRTFTLINAQQQDIEGGRKDVQRRGVEVAQLRERIRELEGELQRARLEREESVSVEGLVRKVLVQYDLAKHEHFERKKLLGALSQQKQEIKQLKQIILQLTSFLEQGHVLPESPTSPPRSSKDGDGNDAEYRQTVPSPQSASKIRSSSKSFSESHSAEEPSPLVRRGVQPPPTLDPTLIGAHGGSPHKDKEVPGGIQSPPPLVVERQQEADVARRKPPSRPAPHPQVQEVDEGTPSRFHERTINSSTTSESADLTLLSEGGESSHAEEGETREAETDASHWQGVHTTLFNPFMRAPAPPSASGNSRAAAAPPPPPVVFQRLVGASTASTRESPPPLLDGEPEWKRILREARARPPREENRRERNEEGRDDSEEDLPRSAFRSLVRDVL